MAPKPCAGPGPTSSGGCEMTEVNVEPGAAIPELKVTPDKYLPHRYAGASGDFNPIHIDPEFAKAVGLPQNILHGLYSMAITARGANALAEGDPRGLRRLSVQFRGMGIPEQEIVVSGKVESLEEGVATVSLVAAQ